MTSAAARPAKPAAERILPHAPNVRPIARKCQPQDGSPRGDLPRPSKAPDHHHRADRERLHAMRAGPPRVRRLEGVRALALHDARNLHARAHAELCEHVAQVGLDRLLRQEQLRRDLLFVLRSVTSSAISRSRELNDERPPPRRRGPWPCAAPRARRSRSSHWTSSRERTDVNESNSRSASRRRAPPRPYRRALRARAPWKRRRCAASRRSPRARVGIQASPATREASAASPRASSTAALACAARACVSGRSMRSASASLGRPTPPPRRPGRRS